MNKFVERGKVNGFFCSDNVLHCVTIVATGFLVDDMNINEYLLVCDVVTTRDMSKSERKFYRDEKGKKQQNTNF